MYIIFKITNFLKNLAEASFDASSGAMAPLPLAKSSPAGSHLLEGLRTAHA